MIRVHGNNQQVIQHISYFFKAHYECSLFHRKIQSMFIKFDEPSHFFTNVITFDCMMLYLKPLKKVWKILKWSRKRRLIQLTSQAFGSIFQTAVTHFKVSRISNGLKVYGFFSWNDTVIDYYSKCLVIQEKEKRLYSI